MTVWPPPPGMKMDSFLVYRKCIVPTCDSFPLARGPAGRILRDYLERDSGCLCLPAVYLDLFGLYKTENLTSTGLRKKGIYQLTCRDTRAQIMSSRPTFSASFFFGSVVRLILRLSVVAPTIVTKASRCKSNRK